MASRPRLCLWHSRHSTQWHLSRPPAVSCRPLRTITPTGYRCRAENQPTMRRWPAQATKSWPSLTASQNSSRSTLSISAPATLASSSRSHATVTSPPDGAPCVCLRKATSLSRVRLPSTPRPAWWNSHPSPSAANSKSTPCVSLTPTDISATTTSRA